MKWLDASCHLSYFLPLLVFILTFQKMCLLYHVLSYFRLTLLIAKTRVLGSLPEGTISVVHEPHVRWSVNYYFLVKNFACYFVWKKKSSHQTRGCFGKAFLCPTAKLSGCSYVPWPLSENKKKQMAGFAFWLWSFEDNFNFHAGLKKETSYSALNLWKTKFSNGSTPKKKKKKMWELNLHFLNKPDVKKKKYK